MIDFTVFPTCSGKRFRCTILDSFTRYFVARACPGERAIDAARKIVEEIVLRHQVVPKPCRPIDRVCERNGKTVRKRIKMLSKLAKVANLSVDLELERRSKRHAPARPLKKGDLVHLYRPVTKAAKDSGCNWIGPYRVAKSSERVVKICDSTGFADWVHRSHLRYLPERKDHLKTADKALEYEILFGDDQLASPQNRPVDASGSYSEPLAALPRAGRPTANKPDKARDNSRKRKRLRGKIQPAAKRSNSASAPAVPSNSTPAAPPKNSTSTTSPQESTSLSTTPSSTRDSSVTGKNVELPDETTSASTTADSLRDSLNSTVSTFFDQFTKRSSGRVTKKPDRLTLDPKRKNYAKK